MIRFPSQQSPINSTIRPYGVYEIQGIAFREDNLIAIDAVRGYLLEIDPVTENTTILNPHHTAQFKDATGLAIWEDTLWFTRYEDVYYCQLSDFEAHLFVRLPYQANSVSVWESTVYVSCQRASSILVFNKQTKEQITRFYAPGIGSEHITIRGEELWVSDQLEQTIYCLDRGTGETFFSLLTPFASPTGLAFHNPTLSHENVVYVAYAGEEAYIRDDPNSPDPHQLTFRSCTFIHPVYFQYDKANKICLSNGFLIEMSYVEEVSPLDDIEVENLEWRMALPSNTLRQKVRHIESVGMPFSEEIQNGEKVAVFKFDKLCCQEARILGWKALIEVYSIKYNLTPSDVENLPELPADFDCYLEDNDNLAMDSKIIRQAATKAIRNETNFLRQVLSIRDYVYDRLSYGIKPYIDPPDVAWERGVGSCGEYVGILLAFMRLNNIPCRTIGRYKCPPYADRVLVPLIPDYNHVWIEFYVPGFGWVPMESNPDDIQEGGPYPLRFFMGLAWYHIEIGKGLKFAGLRVNGEAVNKEQFSINELAINHIRFKILDELRPM